MHSSSIHLHAPDMVFLAAFLIVPSLVIRVPHCKHHVVPPIDQIMECGHVQRALVTDGHFSRSGGGPPACVAWRGPADQSV